MHAFVQTRYDNLLKVVYSSSLQSHWKTVRPINYLQYSQKKKKEQRDYLDACVSIHFFHCFAYSLSKCSSFHPFCRSRNTQTIYTKLNNKGKLSTTMGENLVVTEAVSLETERQQMNGSSVRDLSSKVEYCVPM